MACTPRAVPLEPGERAEASGRVRVGAFELTPPGGRWIAEPCFELDAPPEGGARWRNLLASVSHPSGEGVRLCRLSRVRWETPSGGTEPREDCLALQPVTLDASLARVSSTRELLERLAPLAHAIEADDVGEPDFWSGVRWFGARGEATLARIGANDYAELHLVARDEPSRTLRAGGRLLLVRAPVGAWLAAFVADAGLVAHGTEAYRMLASLTPSAP